MSKVEWLTCLTLVFFLCGIPLSYCGGLIGINPNYSNGVMIGTPIKGSYKGMLWKSYEFQMQITDFQLRGVTSGRDIGVFEFSTTDEKLAKSLQNKVGKKVKVEYSQWWSKPFTQDTPYTLKSFEVIEE